MNGVEAPGAADEVTSSASVPAGANLTVVLPRPVEWTLLVNGEAVYDSLHEPGDAPVISVGIEVDGGDRIRVLP